MKTLANRDLIRAINEDVEMVMLGRITDIDDSIIYFTATDGEELMVFGDVEDITAFIAAHPEHTNYTN